MIEPLSIMLVFRQIVRFVRTSTTTSINKVKALPLKALEQQVTVIDEILKNRLKEEFGAFLNRKEMDGAVLQTSLTLLDFEAHLRSTIAFNSAQRQGQLSSLSTLLQQTLDAVRDALNDLRGEIQSTDEATLATTRQQRLEGELQRKEGALGVALGEFRTKCEAVKLRAIYAFTMGIAGIFLAIVIESSRKRNNRIDKLRAKGYEIKEDYSDDFNNEGNKL